MKLSFRRRSPRIRRTTSEEVLASLEPYRKAHTLAVELNRRFRLTTPLLEREVAAGFVSPITPTKGWPPL